MPIADAADFAIDEVDFDQAFRLVDQSRGLVGARTLLRQPLSEPSTLPPRVTSRLM
jgi:hypothetical protein